MAQESEKGLRAVLMAAAFVIVVAGLRAAAPILVPVLIAIFVAILSGAPIRYLQKRGLPDAIAALLVFAGVLVALVLLSTFVGSSVRDFSENLPSYQKHLETSFAGVLAWAEGLGLSFDKAELKETVDTGSVVRLAQSLMSGISGVLSDTAFVMLTVAFILGEMTSFSRKVRAAMTGPSGNIDEYFEVVANFQTYFAIKTKVSMATGAIISIFTASVGLDYPLLWGLVAFLLNFVPTLGSIIAAVPAVLLAFVQLGWASALVIGGGYVVVNIVIGSILEPRLMGRRLGLSALVVFLSLVFWGWVFGPAGMLLSVPLTMVAKIFFEHSEDLRWLGILLGPGDELEHHEQRAAARRSSQDDEPLLQPLEGSPTESAP